MVNEMKFRRDLENYRLQHEEVSANIGYKMDNKVVNQFDILRLKKRKAELKEMITELEEYLFGDVVA